MGAGNQKEDGTRRLTRRATFGTGNEEKDRMAKKYEGGQGRLEGGG